MKSLFVLAVLLAAGGDSYDNEAKWSFRWGPAEGAESADRWTDIGETCKTSESNEWNMRALFHKSKLTTCAARCKKKAESERLACRLRCDSAIELVGKTCVDVKNKRPSRSWIDMH